MVDFNQGAVNDGAEILCGEKFQNLTASWIKAFFWSLRYLEVSILDCNDSHLV